MKISFHLKLLSPLIHTIALVVCNCAESSSEVSWRLSSLFSPWFMARGEEGRMNTWDLDIHWSLLLLQMQRDTCYSYVHTPTCYKQTIIKFLPAKPFLKNVFTTFLMVLNFLLFEIETKEIWFIEGELMNEMIWSELKKWDCPKICWNDIE